MNYRKLVEPTILSAGGKWTGSRVRLELATLGYSITSGQGRVILFHMSREIPERIRAIDSFAYEVKSAPEDAERVPVQDAIAFDTEEQK